jgi:4,5-dihydroxyphthalate decarboxylase
VFPSRAFRHSQIYVNAKRGIAGPDDLRGRRVGIPEYHMTAGVWMRAFLEEDFGVGADEIEWVTPAEALAYIDEVDFPLPEGLRLVATEAGLDGLLAAGEIDALFTVTAPPSYADPESDVVRLFPNYRTVEEEYYRRTALFPIMHTVVMRRDLEREAPALALELVERFQSSKDAGIRRLTNLNAAAIVDPWLGDDLERVAGLFGGDPFVYGIEANRATLEAMLRYHFDQGLSRAALSIEQVFVPATLDWRPAEDALARRRW